MCYFFLDILGQDLLGLSLATLTAFSAKLLFLLTYSCCKKEILETTQPLNAATFRDWGSYIKIALPATLTQCSDWWAFEILVFISGYAGVS